MKGDSFVDINIPIRKIIMQYRHHLNRTGHFKPIPAMAYSCFLPSHSTIKNKAIRKNNTGSVFISGAENTDLVKIPEIYLNASPTLSALKKIQENIIIVNVNRVSIKMKILLLLLRCIRFSSLFLGFTLT